MKNLMVGLIAIFALPAFSDELPSEALVSGPEADAAAYTCDLHGAIEGFKLGFILDGQLLGGDAVIHCKDATNRGLRDVSLPVHVKIVGGGVGFDFTIVKRATI